MDDAELRRVRQLVVHDLRSPLAVILGQCDLLEMRGRLTEADAASIEAVQRAAHRVLALVDEASDLLPRRH
jgi:signal transduction histidine kinase